MPASRMWSAVHAPDSARLQGSTWQNVSPSTPGRFNERVAMPDGATHLVAVSVAGIVDTVALVLLDQIVLIHKGSVDT
jgi:hypothetical protein